MLEILLVMGLCKLLGNILRAKGRKPFLMQVMLVVTWILGEFAGGLVSAVVREIRSGEAAPMPVSIYLFAIVGAAMGGGFTFLVAYMLPTQHPESPQETLSDNTFERRLDPNNPYAS